MYDYAYGRAPWYSLCSQITSIQFPVGITELGEMAFVDTAVTQVSFPNTLELISDVAFWNCTSLTSVSIPSSVREIGYDAFYMCDSLTTFTVDTQNPTNGAAHTITFVDPLDASDATLVKTGLGRFYGTNDLAIRERIKQIVVREGTYVGNSTDSWGASPGHPGTRVYVKVEDGAPALVETIGAWDQCFAQNISFELGGDGAATSGGYSLAFRGSSWRMTYGCRFILRNDTQFGHMSKSSMGIFSQSTTVQNGHTLVLRGLNGVDSNFRFREYHTFRSPGPIVVSNATLSASYTTGNGWQHPDGKPPLLKFGRNSKFA